jgi:dolichol-phosphate mannosyltransferase
VRRLVPDLGVVVPFFNEERTAGRLVTDLLQTLRASGLSYEVALVADGSSDGTVRELTAAAAGDRCVQIVCDGAAAGYGAAIRHGLSLLSADVVAWTDGDGQVPSSTLVEIRDAMKAHGSPMGMGIRRSRRDGWLRIVASRGYNWMMRCMLGVSVEDINAKPKLIDAQLLRRIAPTSKDWFIDTELVVGALVRGADIVRVPVPFLAREHGSSKVGSSILREYWRNLRGYRRRLRADGFLGPRVVLGRARVAAGQPEGQDGRPGAED